MRDYHSRAVDRIYAKLKPKLEANAKKLVGQTGYFTCDYQEIWQEISILFYEHFEEYYESDSQYLSFLYICLKNRIRNFQRRDYTHHNRESTDLNMIRNKVGLQPDHKQGIDHYQATWGQVEDPSNPWTELEFEEMMNNASSIMDSVGKRVFESIFTDNSHKLKDICEYRNLFKKNKDWTLTVNEKRRFKRLGNKPHMCDMTVREVFDVVENQIRQKVMQVDPSYHLNVAATAL